jgi:cardiolipin synthase
MEIKLIVDSEEFWEKLEKDIFAAKKRICIQLMTFEGDSAGLKLADAIAGSAAAEKRILVDEYTKYVISDRFIYMPGNMRNPDLQAEVKSTKQMFARLQQEGTRVKWTNPAGFLLKNFPRRNHKKIFIIDDVLYLGGINFSDHNFSWHDMMIRIEARDVTDFVYTDFMVAWHGPSIAHHKDFDGFSIHFLDGSDNENGYQYVLDLIDKARKEILVISPYISYPFIDHLRAAVARDINVILITPDNNNKKRLRTYLLYECRDEKIKLYLYRGMFHLKGMLIDNECLIMGSSNFDYISYRIEEEVIVYVRCKHIIDDFRKRVFENDLNNSEIYSGKIPWLTGWLHNFLLKGIADISVGICRGFIR